MQFRGQDFMLFRAFLNSVFFIIGPGLVKLDFAKAKTKAQISCAVTSTADQPLCFHYTDSKFPLLFK